MKYFTLLLILLFNFHSSANYSIKENYSLFKDKSLIDNRLLIEMYESYIETDLNLSIDAYSLSSDLSDISQSSSSSTEKEEKVLNLLNENRNTQNFVDLNSSLAIPIPTLKYKKYFITSSIFYNLDLSSMFAISEFDGASEVSSKVYMRKESRVGLSAIVTKEHNKESLIKLNAFYMKKSDVLINQTVADLVSNTKIYDFGTLNQGESSVAFDILWKTTNLHRTYRLEVFDLQVFSIQKDKDLIIKNSPLFHGFYQFHEETLKKYWLEYFAGAHYRDNYSVINGLYVGVWLRFKESPFRSSISLSKQFLTIAPEYKRKNFFFNYKLKWSYLGDIDGFESPLIHSLNTGFSF